MGRIQTALTRYKISLAKTKDRTELLQNIIVYIDGLTEGDFPSITQCAISCSISEKALLAYEFRTPDNSDVRILLDIIRDRQKEALTTGGLTKKFDSKFAIFLLKVHHVMKEESPNLTQNNIFNVSPEILAEAIEMTRAKKAQNSREITST